MEESRRNPIMVGLDGKSHERRKRGESDIQYKLIRNGTDEYKWWIEEAITEDSAGGGYADLNEGKHTHGRKRFILPESYSLPCGLKP